MPRANLTMRLRRRASTGFDFEEHIQDIARVGPAR